ncbi:galactose mutarotase-like protein [Amanita muscaria]
MLRVVIPLILALASAADPWPFDVTELSAPDGSITAKFVSLGATLTELWVKDKFGKARDVVLGYDNNTLLLTDPIHPVFNAIVGRYANRIKGGTFSIPITKDPQLPGPNVYQIPINDPSRESATLHGGIKGWDRRNWTIVARTPTSVTYRHLDDADEGFPGNATHAVFSGGILRSSVYATATQKTPIMLTQHVYWNLDAFQDGSANILNHKLTLDASRTIAVDGNQVPTGPFLNVEGTPFDFRHESRINKYQDNSGNLCGSGCKGYDNAWVYDLKDHIVHPGTSLYSDLSGIRLDIMTNQPSVQVYTPIDVPIPRKVIHGGPNIDYGSWPAVAIEQQGYLDAINTPEWNVDQIHYPGRDFEWSTEYRFCTVL